jgi:hypothetical protein
VRQLLAAGEPLHQKQCLEEKVYLSAKHSSVEVELRDPLMEVETVEPVVEVVMVEHRQEVVEIFHHTAAATLG